MPVAEATVALGLIIITVSVWFVRQHTEAARNAPIIAGPIGAIIPLVCGLIALFILSRPYFRMLPSPPDMFGYSVAATQTAVAVQIVPTPTPSPEPLATPAPTPAFVPYWVKNHRRTQMWSGRAGPPGVVSFGVTSNQFCVFQVVRLQDNTRLYVLNPYDKNYFWIDAEDIGPIAEEPEHRPGPKPSGQNCADVIYDD